MSKVITCIICPNGCDIDVQADGQEILAMDGALCPRGKEYVIQELRDPQRNIASSALVEGGEMPLVSVRLTAPVPKDRIFEVMEQIRQVSVKAPVRMGDILLANVLGLESHVIATRHVQALAETGMRRAG